MTDPLTLASLTAVGLAEGIKFLYAQATELLRRRRERKDGQNEARPSSAPSKDVLAGPVSLTDVDEELLERKLSAIQELYAQLALPGQGLADVDPADSELVTRAEALRGLLELVYGERITFRGEQREPSGTRVDARLEAQRVDGYVAAVRTKTISGDVEVRTSTRVGDVAAEGEAVGIEADRIGGH